MMRHVAANGLTLLILALVVLFGLVGWGQSRYSAPGPLSAPLVFEVPRGAGLASVSRELADKGAISSESLFRIAARYTGAEAGLKFGEYQIPAGASMEQILALLNERGEVSVDELSRRFETSEVTIRKDLAALEKNGLLLRRYGLGCDVVPDPYYGEADGFDNVLNLIEEASDALLAEIKGRL